MEENIDLPREKIAVGLEELQGFKPEEILHSIVSAVKHCIFQR